MHNCQFTVLSLLLSALILIFVLPTAHASSILEFNQDLHVIEHSGFVIYTNSSFANNNMTDSVIANFTSQSNGTGLLVTLQEDEDDGILQSNYVKFSTFAGTGELLVAVGDWVHASYGILSDNSTVVSAAGSLSWAPKIANGIHADCVDYGGDSDNDAICNNWENQTSHSINGLSSGLNIDFPSGNGFYHYPCDPSCPDPEYIDIFLEIDYMEGHRPNEKALQNVIDAFANSPISNDNGTNGINLHIQIDDSDVLGHKNELKPGGINHPRAFGTDQVKAVYYGTTTERSDSNWDPYIRHEKKHAFHYGLFIHQQKANLDSSGYAEVFGNDLGVSLGSWSGMIGSTDEQEGTLMHELGHNLNLYHGGASNDAINCKPNYISVMNYAYQFSDLSSDRSLDFSKKALGTTVNGSTSLVENNLDESKGVGSYYPNSEQKIVFGPTLPLMLPETGGAIDWNQDGDSTDSGIIMNLNKLDDIGCTSTDSTETLSGYDDWNNLVFDTTGTGNWADGRSEFAKDEITIKDVKNMRIIRLQSLENFIDQLDENKFYDKNQAKNVKEQFSTDFKELKNMIQHDKTKDVEKSLKDMKKSFVGDAQIQDLIIDKKSQDYLLKGIDDILKSLKKTIR